MERDAIDFKKESVGKLFVRMLVPTLLGMVLTATITIADGVFVGHGVGSDALAAVNIVAPFFMLATGIGLMFGTGCSIVASIHLAHNKRKAANINVTQSLIVSVLLMVFLCAIVLLFRKEVAYALGASDRLMPFVMEYMTIIMPFLPMNMLLSIGLFVIRLDGSPRYAMWCNAVAGGVNVVLDYLFVFPFGWGLAGAAWATGIAEIVGALMVCFYLLFYSKVLKLYRLKFSYKSLRLTLRNVGYMIRLGFSSLLSELAIAFMMLVGNFVFMDLLHEDGVAAYSVACYCFPIIFMICNAIAQSIQPIVSYNYGLHHIVRVRKAFAYGLLAAVGVGVVVSVGALFLSRPLVGLFLSSELPAYIFAVEGMPYFASGALFFALNIICIVFLQSLEYFKTAAFLMLLRGFVLVGLMFVSLPMFMSVKGAWLAVPLTEGITFVGVALYLFCRKNAIYGKVEG